MDTLNITKQNALAAYNNGCDDVKKVLRDLFGTNTFIPEKITDRVKTFDDACKELSMVFVANRGDSKDEASYKKLKIIVEALNEGWIPDWKNSSQYKYYPWFDMSSGSGLSYDGYGNRRSFSCVGSRLCFKSRELAEYAGKQFIDIYTDFFIIN